MGFFWRNKRRSETSESTTSEAAEIESLHGEVLHEDDVEEFYGPDADDGSKIVFFISIAVLAVSAVLVTVHRIWSAVGGGERRREQPPKKAFVLHLPSPENKREPKGMTPPDNNLSFVVPEDFKLGFAEAANAREPWQRCLCFVLDQCQIVDQLLRKGAKCIGKAFTDPLPYNLIESGDVVFRNPQQEGAVTGGDYSGCGVIVGGGLANFALATDTVGDARMAAACCGVIGFKPTIGSVLLNGISQRSAALDTISFMVKHHEYLTRIGDMMEVPGNNMRGEVFKVYLAKDLFDIWLQSENKEMRSAVSKAALSWAGQEQVEEVDLGDFLSIHAGGWKNFDSENIFEALRKVVTTIADYELKIKLQKECNAPSPENGEEVDRYSEALEIRHCVQEAFKHGIRDSKLVVLPALMRSPPSRNADASELKRFEVETQRLYALASLVGCPQLIFPIRNKNKELYSVSILSLNKTDKQLLTIGEKLIQKTYQMLDVELLNQRRRAHDREMQQDERVSQKLLEGERTGETWHERGNTCYKNSQFEHAVIAYTEAIRQCPYKDTSYSNRAMAHIKLNMFQAAEDDCRKAIDLNPGNAKAFLRRGFARKGLGKYIEAQADFDKVLSLEPNNRQARQELRELDHLFETM